LQGRFIPFARTRQERANDPRLSIEERYSSKEAYVAAIKKAADEQVAIGNEAARGREPAGVAPRA
jgi:hypothetical protein